MRLYKLAFFTPPEYLERVKEAIFAAGAGKLGHYDSCCFDTAGIGQFRPTKESNPFIGTKNELTKIEEIKTEVICNESCVRAVLKSLKEAHPYEEVAFDLIALENHLYTSDLSGP